LHDFVRPLEKFKFLLVGLKKLLENSIRLIAMLTGVWWIGGIGQKTALYVYNSEMSTRNISWG
jgi:hypothetical protein